MTTLSYKQDKTISLQELEQLGSLINIDLTSYTPENEANFGNLFFEHLVEKTNSAISLDWKWDVETLLHFINAYTSLNLQAPTETPEYPDEIIEKANRLLVDRQFVAIDFEDDSYDWLLVQKDFNFKLFEALTGYTNEAPLANAEAYIEYLPSIQYSKVENGKVTQGASVGVSLFNGMFTVQSSSKELIDAFQIIVDSFDPNESINTLSSRIKKSAPKEVGDFIINE